jgi:glycosyltransferase involved in cell wall biosynthesis
MRIGFDVSQTGQAKAGCGWFADSLIRHLAEIDSQNEYLLYPTFGDLYWDAQGPEATTQINKPNFRRGLSHPTLAEAQQFWRNPDAQFEAQLGSPDIVHSNNFFCPRGLTRARLVYTLYDLIFLEHPESTTEANRVGCFAGVFNASLRADLIVAISNYSRRHFLDTFPHYPPDRVHVVHLASRFQLRADCTRPEKLARLQPGRFWLNVGTIEPRKNLRRLLQAYARLKEQLGGSFPLVLAGGKGWLMEGFDSFVEQLGLRQDVVILGYAEESELQWLYQNCFAFLYPSLFEGFGLPVLEAMSLGAPVIASNTTSLPEIVGPTGLLVDPFQEGDIFQAMLKLSIDHTFRAKLRDSLVEQAKQFSWIRTASEVQKVYREALRRPRFGGQPAQKGSELDRLGKHFGKLGRDQRPVVPLPRSEGSAKSPDEHTATRPDVWEMPNAADESR